MDTRKRLKRQSNRKARIIDAASRLVVERGLEDLSLTAIAKAAGISKGTLYYYYATKESLVFDIAEKHVRDITDVIFELIDAGGPSSEPEELIGLLFRKHKSNRMACPGARSPWPSVSDVQRPGNSGAPDDHHHRRLECPNHAGYGYGFRRRYGPVYCHPNVRVMGVPTPC